MTACEYCAFSAQVTLDLKLELPQVAVVGSQSSGKSSVLEALVMPALPCVFAVMHALLLSKIQPEMSNASEFFLQRFIRCLPSAFKEISDHCRDFTMMAGIQVGRDFLPRGPDICTRRPLVLQLVRIGFVKLRSGPCASS